MLYYLFQKKTVKKVEIQLEDFDFKMELISLESCGRLNNRIHRIETLGINVAHWSLALTFVNKLIQAQQ